MPNIKHSDLVEQLGVNHVHIVEPPVQFHCHYCGDVVVEPEDAEEAIFRTNHPEKVVCLDCEWRMWGDYV